MAEIRVIPASESAEAQAEAKRQFQKLLKARGQDVVSDHAMEKWWPLSFLAEEEE